MPPMPEEPAVPVAVTEGTKELQDAIEAVGPLAAEIIKIIKTGKAKGAAALVPILIKDCVPGTPLWNAVTNAIQGAEKIPAECKDLTVEEIGVLVPIATTQVFQIIAALKAPVAV
jgi:hypothetical protein